MAITQETAKHLSETKSKYVEVPQARLRWNLVMDFDSQAR